PFGRSGGGGGSGGGSNTEYGGGVRGSNTEPTTRTQTNNAGNRVGRKNDRRAQQLQQVGSESSGASPSTDISVSPRPPLSYSDSVAKNNIHPYASANGVASLRPRRSESLPGPAPTQIEGGSTRWRTPSPFGRQTSASELPRRRSSEKPFPVSSLIPPSPEDKVYWQAGRQEGDEHAPSRPPPSQRKTPEVRVADDARGISATVDASSTVATPGYGARRSRREQEPNEVGSGEGGG
ncbi:unnamed protein product, partial [Sphacelaria rigidula]